MRRWIGWRVFQRQPGTSRAESVRCGGWGGGPQGCVRHDPSVVSERYTDWLKKKRPLIAR